VSNDCNHPNWPSHHGTPDADDDQDGCTACNGDCDDDHASAWSMGEVTGLRGELQGDDVSVSWDDMDDELSPATRDAISGPVSVPPSASRVRSASETTRRRRAGRTRSRDRTQEGRYYLARAKHGFGKGAGSEGEPESRGPEIDACP
jgi:hypothetical protein